MKIRNVEQLGLAVLNPSRASQRLAFWAMAIRAGVITVAFMAALITAFEVRPALPFGTPRWLA
jgi:hypothetical protein